MMKTRVNIFFLLFLSFLVQSQEKSWIPRTWARNTNDMSTIDSAVVKVWYAFNDTVINDPRSYDDLGCLEIGKICTKYYSAFIFSSDSAVTAYRNNKKNAKTVPSSIGFLGKNGWTEYQSSEIFTYFQKGLIYEYANMPAFMGKYKIYSTDSVFLQQWQIEEDTLTIIGFLCQKATCHFRGRDYVAWFASEIPYSCGPWKFGGLPGLILKIANRDNLYSFEAISISSQKSKNPIRIYNFYKSYNKWERNQLLKLQKNIRENFIKVTGLKLADNKKPPKIVYYPMELE